MSSPEPVLHPPHIGALDIALLIALAVLWGTSPMLVKIAVQTLPPVTLTAGRVTLAALLALTYLYASGRRLPGSLRLWAWFTVIAILGMVIPFCFLAWGQIHVDSAISAICLASVPLFSFPLAHLLTQDEKLNGAKIAGILIGFAGILLLFLGQTVSDGGGDPNNTMTALGIGAILLGAFSYAIEGLLIRRLYKLDSVVFATAGLVVAAIIMIPLSLILDRPWTLSPSTNSLTALLILSVFGTAFANYILILLISRVGATTASLNNYVVPVIGVACGVIWLNEILTWAMVAACLLILSGVAVASRQPVTNKQQSGE